MGTQQIMNKQKLGFVWSMMCQQELPKAVLRKLLLLLHECLTDLVYIIRETNLKNVNTVPRHAALLCFSFYGPGLSWVL